MNEEWKPIMEFPFYEASSLGRIRSMDRVVERKNPRNGLPMTYISKGRILKPKLKYGRNKYVRESVNLYLKVKYTTQFVHRLILIAFHGKPEEGMVCCHGDGNPLNNSLSNLRWDTLSENSKDTIKHGRFNYPSKKDKG